MRKIESSGNTVCATRLSSRAEARSRPNGFSTITRAFSAKFAAPKPFDHRLEERGGDGQVVCGVRGATQLLFDRRECARVVIIPTHVLEQGQKMAEGPLVIDPARSLDAVGNAFVQLRQTPLGEGDADDRDLEITSLHHGIERREDHLVGEIARHTEEHQRVGTGGGHQAPTSLVAAFSLWPPNW